MKSADRLTRRFAEMTGCIKVFALFENGRFWIARPSMEEAEFQAMAWGPTAKEEIEIRPMYMFNATPCESSDKASTAQGIVENEGDSE